MRNRFIFFLILIMFFTACERKIVLRVDPVETLPFSKKIEQGEYELNFYKLSYPDEIFAKEKFYRELNVLVKKLYVKDKKRDVVISEDFYEDYMLISEGKFLIEEEVIEKIASNLTKDEQEKLRKLTGLSIPKFSNTVQEYLNIQVFHLLKILDRSDEFDQNKIYTEREKNNLVLEIKEQRKEIADIIKQMELNIIINISNPYKQSHEKEYWDDIDIKLQQTKGYIRPDVAQYDYPVYIENLTQSDLEEIMIGNQLFINKVVILKNNIYSGYLYNASKKKFVFFTGGDEERKRFSGYGIKITVKEIKFSDLISLDEKYILTDFIGGNK